MPIKINDYNKINWRELVYYCASSPTYIRYRVGNNCKGIHKRVAKDIAGYCAFNKDGTPKYSTLKYQKKNYLIHRIIYILFYGSISNELVVNHINFNTHENYPDNLELCTFRENLNRTKIAKKLKFHYRNKSGITGVNECIKNNGYKLYYYAIVTWQDREGKNQSKRFSYEKHGKEAAWELAKEFAEITRNKIV